MECPVGDFLLFDTGACSQVLGAVFSSPPSASLSHSSMRSSTIHLPRSSSCSYARLTDFPRHDRSPTTQVSRLAADWQPRSSVCPTVGTSMSCSVPETFGNSDRTRRFGNVWLRVVVERRLPRPQLPLPFSHGFSERQRRESLGNTSQNAARRVSVCYMHNEQVGRLVGSHGTRHICQKSKQKIHASNGVT